MGTWDNSILGNDMAHDYLIDIINTITEVVERDISEMSSDGLLQRPTPVAILVLNALAQNIETVRRIVRSSDVERWMIAFLTWFDNNSQEFGASETLIAAEKRELVQLFQSLITLTGV